MNAKDSTPETQTYANNAKTTISETILEEAERLVAGDRQWAYDHPKDNCKRIGQIWGVILERDPIPPETVGLMMGGLKVARQMFRPTRDNLVDIAGYSKVIDIILNEKTKQYDPELRYTEKETSDDRQDSGNFTYYDPLQSL